MSRLSSFLLGIVVGIVGMLVSMNFYIVRSKESLHVVAKVASKLELPFYDIRAYTVEDWKRHPSLALAIVQSKDQSLMQKTGVDAVRQQVEGLLRQLTTGL